MGTSVLLSVSDPLRCEEAASRSHRRVFLTTVDCTFLIHKSLSNRCFVTEREKQLIEEPRSDLDGGVGAWSHA